MKSTIILGSIIAGLLMLTGCGDDECDWTTTDILVSQDWEGERIYLDTFLGPNTLYFETSEAVDSVVWQIGDDPRERSGNPLEINFDRGVGEIEVRATAYGGCLSGEPTQRSKTIWILPPQESPLVGKYSAYDTQTPEDTFEIELFYWTNTSERVFISDFPQLCDSVRPLLASAGSYTYGFVRMGNDGGLISIYHRENPGEYFNPALGLHLGCYIDDPLYDSQGTLQEDRKTLIIDYQFGTGNGEVEQRRVIATKIE